MWATVCNNSNSIHVLEPYTMTSSLGDLESVTDISTRLDEPGMHPSDSLPSIPGFPTYFYMIQNSSRNLCGGE
jgi:hypothetical protein